MGNRSLKTVPSGSKACACAALVAALALGTGAPSGLPGRAARTGSALRAAETSARPDPALAPRLAALRGVRPRLYLRADGVKKLQAAVRSTHRTLWTEVRAQADEATASSPPEYRGKDEAGGDNQQLWQRPVANALPLLAFAHLLTGEPKYLEALRRWCLASVSYPTWGLAIRENVDLAAGQQLFGLGIAYDWCHASLGEETRRAIRETILLRGGTMFEAARSRKAWWVHTPRQNHLWINACGLAVAGLAVHDEAPETAAWVALALERLRESVATFGPDGASHEGVGYWEYGVEHLLKIAWVARDLLDADILDHPWWKSTAHYALHLSLPRASWTRKSCIVDIGDSARGHWYGPDYILRGLARAFRDPHAQWLAEEVDRADVDLPASRWLNLVWFDPGVKPQPPTRLPTLRHFEDMGIVAARSDWSGNESLVVLKCGPFIGHEGMRRFRKDPGGGHAHPDANHLVIHGGGEWLLRDDGYVDKWTGGHNTLLVGGKGQVGEGQKFFDGAAALDARSAPRILGVAASPRLDRISGDATQAYPRQAGLERFVRHALFIKPDIVVVVDDIILGDGADGVRGDAPPLELRFHPESERAERDGNAFLVAGAKTSLRLELLTPDGVAASAEKSPSGSGGKGGEALFAIRLGTEKKAWRNAVAISWAPRGSAPPRVGLAVRGKTWTFTSPRLSVRLDPETGAATLAPAGSR